MTFFESYEDTCKLVRKHIIKPILTNYEKAGIFEHEEAIETFTARGTFNNKLTLNIMKVSEENNLIRQRSKGYI